MTAAIANRGFYFTPHFLKSFDGNPIADTTYTKAHQTRIDKKYFAPVIEGMQDVFRTGTAKHVRLKNIEICGKTGTAENFIRVKGTKYQFEDHSIFVAFAPKKDPKIAIAVYIENGGFGSTIAAPIASLMIEKYITRDTTNKWWENKMFTTNLESVYKEQEEIRQSKRENTK
jgi:penicillin-binding protein 2